MRSVVDKIVFVLSLLFLLSACTVTNDHDETIQIDLNGEWVLIDSQTKQEYVAQVPGTVHTDLLNNKEIPDPFFGVNELKVQWVERRDWSYSRDFMLDESDLDKKIDLICEGLDTYAEIVVNGEKVSEADNMFIRWKFDVSEHLVPGKNNIRINFFSPFNILKERVESLDYVLPADNELGEYKYSPFCRKAAYHFGWDWAPRMVTCGIWKEIYLEEDRDVDLVDVAVLTTRLENGLAKLELRTTIQSDINTSVNINFGEWVSATHIISRGINEIIDTFKIGQPDLWWPNGMGTANLYKEEIKVVESRGSETRKDIKFGIRTVELIQEEDSIGTSFYFKINGEKTFAKGANYIPQDVFLPRVRPADYRRLLNDAKEANMNMMRVWGGGIYEKDLFYELCDSLGLMVWQDFMFAGTMYPIDSVFLKNVEGEIEQEIRRLRKHPSIVVWCGNNEIEVAWNNWGWQEKYDYSESLQEALWHSYTNLFYRLIPGAIQRFTPYTPYTPTSPLSNWGTAENFNHGSMHYWGVWHGRENIEEFKNNVGRFMVEYGMQSYPEMSTIHKFAEAEHQNLSSHVMNHRQKSYIGNVEILKQVRQRYGMVTDFEDFIEKSQRLQAEGMGIAIDAHINSKGHCMGSLLWQLNDCWPGPSWSIIDYFGNKKPAYHSVKQRFE